MAALAEALEQRRAVVLSGGAGTGKSRLAAEYTHRHVTRGFWTAAGETVDRTLAALAPLLGVLVEGRNEEEVTGEVQRTLPNLPAGALWVIDNLANIELVNGLANAAGPLKLLVTTRDARQNILPPNVAFQEVPILDPGASVNLLCSRNNCQPDDPTLPKIAEAVGHLPLALEMLAVQLGAPLQTPQTVLEELQKAPTPIEIEAFREAAGATVERPEGVFATIAATLASLDVDHRRALEPLGYLADAPAPLPLVAALTGLEEEALARLLDECRRQSVLSVSDDRVDVHALTAAAIAATNPQESLAEALARNLDRLNFINTDDPVALRGELTHHESVHSKVTKTLGEEDLLVLGLVNSLAIGYFTLGHTQESAILSERTLEINQRVLGPEHPDTLTSRNNLAVVYSDLRRLQEAVELHDGTLKIRERVLGREHPNTLMAQSNLGESYRASGQTQKALYVHQETLEIRERVLGIEHPNTLTSRNNLALSYSDLGRLQEAVELHEGTLKMLERVLGPEHPHSVGSRNNLAIGYRALGQHADADRLEGKEPQ